MVKRKLVTQEEGMGCGLACVASELGISPKSFELISGFEKDIKIFKIY